jgi:rhodanese-related sulfurtransferase/rubrerythrin
MEVKTAGVPLSARPPNKDASAMTQPNPIEEYTPDSLKEFMRRHKEGSYELVDVRQPSEYAQGHIPGARFIPLPDLEATLTGPHSPLPAGTPAIFYCARGHRSHVAAQMARDAGLEQAGHLQGGIDAWSGMSVPQTPRLSVFLEDKDLTAMLRRALDLEKAAYVLYNDVRAKAAELGRDSMCKLMDRIVGMELAHAKQVYRQLAKRIPEPPPFETLFEAAGGDVLEGGYTPDDLGPWVDSVLAEDATCMETAELGLEIEYAAYDLYKTAALAIENRAATGPKLPEGERDEAAAIFMNIAEQEKQHGRMLMDAFDDLLAEGTIAPAPPQEPREGA